MFYAESDAYSDEYDEYSDDENDEFHDEYRDEYRDDYVRVCTSIARVSTSTHSAGVTDFFITFA